MSVRFEKKGAREFAVLPRKEYEALVARAAEAEEDAGTARLVARARRQTAAGAPLIPMEYANRIADGESPIRVLRQWRGMTQTGLAKSSGIGQGYISDLEARRRVGTADVLKRIADVLRVPVDLVIGD